MGFAEAFGSTSTPTASTGGFSAAFGGSAPVNIAQQRQATSTATAPASQPNILSRILSFGSTPAPISSAPLPNVVGQIKDSAMSSFSQGVDAVNTIQKPSTTPIATGFQAGLQLESGISGVAFSPLAPMTNLISKAIDYAGDKLSDTDLIKNYAKGANSTDDAVLTSLQNLGGIAMGILGVEGGGIKASDLSTEQLTELAKHPDVVKAVQDVVDTSKQPPKLTVNSKTPDDINISLNKGKLLSPPYTPERLQAPEQPLLLGEGKSVGAIQGEGFSMSDKTDKGNLEHMQAINKYRDAVSSFNSNPTPRKLTIVKNARATLDGFKVDESLPEPTSEAPVAPETAPTAEQTSNTQEVPSSPTETPQTPVSEAPIGQTAKASNDISDTLVKQGFDALKPEEQAQFTKGSYKDSLAKTSQLLTDDSESVKEMAKTGENIPEGIHPQILFNAVEALATKEGDVGLLQDLAKSPLATKLSESGSTLGSHGFNDNPNSAVERLKQANEAKVGGEKGAKEITKQAKQAKATISKTAARMIDYEAILDKITC